MKLNNLLASPSFASWMEGEPLDVQQLLYTPEGKPRLAIISIAHLDDAERMFFVTLLLNEILAWMRTQPGTSSLRAILYMDEVFGYFPPVGESAVEAADADAAEAGPRVRLGLCAGDAEPGGPRLQRPVQRRHVVLGPIANRARQGPRARRAGRRVGPGGARSSIAARHGSDARRAGQPRVSDEQRARRRAGGVPDAVGDVVPARAADARADQDVDGPSANSTTRRPPQTMPSMQQRRGLPKQLQLRPCGRF